jgi:LEA14-like dessication related protein
MNIEKILKLFKHFIGGDTIDVEGLKLMPTTIEKGEIGRQQNEYIVNFELSNPNDIS